MPTIDELERVQKENEALKAEIAKLKKNQKPKKKKK